MRTNIFKLIASIFTIAILTGCCNCRSYQKRSQRTLITTQWQLSQLMGKNVKLNHDAFYIVFSDDNKISGRGACNNIMGNYTSNKNKSLKIDKLSSTMMMCPDMSQENVFKNALSKTTHYAMDGPMLLLLMNGDILAVFQAK